MTPLAFTRSGTGAPLVLLHGIGSSRQAWDPVIPALAGHFDVIAVDLPGFGDSQAVPDQVEPLPAALAAAVADLLDDLGVTAPHLAGNSLGDWVALELAAIRPAASLTLLSPAGLWHRNTPWYSRASLRASRWLTRHAAGPLSRPGQLPPRTSPRPRPDPRPTNAADSCVRAGDHPRHGQQPRFDATLKATARRRYLAAAPIAAPVTIAFGSRDRLLLRHQSRHLGQLPPGTEIRRVLRPAGAFHFIEHGLSPQETVARWQHRLTPLQRRVFGVCHQPADRPAGGRRRAGADPAG